MKTMNFSGHSQFEATAGSRAMSDLLSTSIKWLLNTDEMDRTYNDRKMEIDRLATLSDAELTKMGITRDQISTYVFRDIFDA